MVGRAVDLAELVQLAQAGDEVAIRELIVSQQTYVFSIARGIMHNEADAADMTQEAFIRVLRSLRGYRAETKFTTWLYRLATNVCLDELRRRGQPAISFESDEEGRASLDPPDPDPWAQPDTCLAAAESAEEVQAALTKLSPPQRLALTLVYFDDMRYEDVAQVMNVPINTVKSHIRRAKDRLADILRTRHNGKEAVSCSAAT